MYRCLRLIYTRCDCNEWKTEKRHECTNMGKLTTRIMMATVRHVTSSSGLRKFQADGFLFDLQTKMTIN